jgi:hypothetical protein
MGIDDLFGFDEEKYSQSLHSKYPTIEALQSNEKKKSAQIAAATGGVAASYASGFVVGPFALVGVGVSGRTLSIATQKRDLIRKALKERYDVGKTSMSGETFFKNAALAVAMKGMTLGAAHGIEHLCAVAIPPGIDAAPHGFGATAAAIAHPEHCLDGMKDSVMTELHAVHTLATTGSPHTAAQQAAMQLAYGHAGDNAYLTGAVIGDHVARGAEKGVVKLAIKGGSKLVSSRLNKSSTPRSKPTTPKSTAKPTVAPTAAKAQEEYLRRRNTGLANTTKTQEKTATAAQPIVKRYTSTQKKLKRQPHPSSDKKHNDGIANWIIAACIFVPLVAIAFYTPSRFGVWLTALSEILIDLLAFIGYALVEVSKLVIIILTFAGNLLNVILTIMLPNVISFVGYELVEVAKAVLGIFKFIR